MPIARERQLLKINSLVWTSKSRKCRLQYTQSNCLLLPIPKIYIIILYLLSLSQIPFPLSLFLTVWNKKYSLLRSDSSLFSKLSLFKLPKKCNNFHCYSCNYLQDNNIKYDFLKELSCEHHKDISHCDTFTLIHNSNFSFHDSRYSFSDILNYEINPITNNICM